MLRRFRLGKAVTGAVVEKIFVNIAQCQMRGMTSAIWPRASTTAIKASPSWRARAACRQQDMALLDRIIAEQAVPQRVVNQGFRQYGEKGLTGCDI